MTHEESVLAGAKIALCILQQWISSEQFKAIQSGKLAIWDSATDTNLCLYGAYAGIHFAEWDPADELAAAWVNQVFAKMESLVLESDK